MGACFRLLIGQRSLSQTRPLPGKCQKGILMDFVDSALLFGYFGWLSSFKRPNNTKHPFLNYSLFYLCVKMHPTTRPIQIIRMSSCCWLLLKKRNTFQTYIRETPSIVQSTFGSLTIVNYKWPNVHMWKEDSSSSSSSSLSSSSSSSDFLFVCCFFGPLSPLFI